MGLMLAWCVLVQPVQLPAIEFDSQPGRRYALAREVAKELNWSLEYDSITGLAKIEGRPIPVDAPKLFDGTLLLEQSVLPSDRIILKVGKPRVHVDLKSQLLKAYQGDLLVMSVQVSSGRYKSDTPPGNYSARKKEPMHISKLYGSPMPYSVHLTGNYFIHGSEQTLSGPGSHGCIRLPLYNSAAQWFFSWIKIGTPIKVTGKRIHSKSSPRITT